MGDGSSVTLPDTPANQQAYPQPESQKPGCGFPVMRLVVFFALATGAIVAIAKGALALGERTLFHNLWDRLQQGDVFLADRGFCSFADMFLLAQRGVDSVLRQHQRRSVGVLHKQRLGKGDRLVIWLRGNARPQWLTEAAWHALPLTMTLREIEFVIDVPGFRSDRIVLVTTLLDAEAYPMDELVGLYRRRWHAELWLRDTKTTMGMDQLRCKTPAMVHKELWMYLIAYNLIRALIFEAARKHDVLPMQVGFKSAVATLRQWAPHMAHLKDGSRQQAAMLRALLRCIARNRVGDRPNRSEPRALKRRLKHFPLLTQPRKTYKEIPHRGKRRKP